MQIKRGWLAVGDGWAVDGASPEEATHRFRQAEQKHREIEARTAPGERADAYAAFGERSQARKDGQPEP